MSLFAQYRLGVPQLRRYAAGAFDIRLYLGIAALWAVLFLPLLTGHRVIPYDSIEAYYATAYFNAQSLRHGQWPWWNPHVYSGYPQVADPQGMMFSPLLMFLMLISENPGVVWFDVSVLLHVLIGAWGFLLLRRAFRFTPAASVIATMVYMVGGVASARLQHTPMVLAYAYLPWVLYCCHRFAGAPTYRNAVLLGVTGGFLLTHLVQPTYLFVLFALLYFGTRLVAGWPTTTRPALLRLAGGVVISVAVAAAIAGVQIAATLAVLPVSTRGAFSFDTIVAASLAPKALATLVWPNVYGTLHGVYSGTQDITESYLYVGIIPLCFLFGFLHRALANPAHRAERIFFVVALVLACAYFLGANTPLYKLLYDYLPGIDLFRRPSDGAFMFNFCLAVLTGFAASAATRPANVKTTKQAGLFMLLTAATWYLTIAAIEWTRGYSYRSILLLGVVALVLSLTVKVVPLRLKERVIVLGVLALCVGDFRVFNIPNRLNAHGKDAANYFADPGVALREIKADPEPLAGGLPFRIEPTRAGELAATGSVIHGLDSTQGYNPLRVRLYAETFGAQEHGYAPRPFTATMPSLDSPLFDLAGTRYLLSTTPIEALAAGNERSRFAKVLSDGELTLWRNPFAYDRILTPTEARVMPAGEPPTAAHFEGVDFTGTLLLYPADTAEEQAARRVAAECKGKASVSEIDFGNNHLALKTSASDSAWVTVSDLFFPGWEARSDDQPLRIWRANGLYRAVCVPAGEHRVRFDFSPFTFIRSALRQSRSPRRPSAIDRQDRAGDRTSGVGGQKHGECPDLLNSDETLGR